MAALLRGVVPIVRGRCCECGDSRNLWVSELVDEDAVPCEHRDRGCQGTYEVVYTGPKGLLPREYENVQCTCGQQSRPQAGAREGSSSSRQDAAAIEANLLEMGFPQADARRAALHCGSLEEAIDWLTAQCGSCEVPSSADESVGENNLLTDIGECTICTEELFLADAAMRCAGQGGKRHYFHAHCLTTWVRQCRSSGNSATCPECRGPVQVRPRRLDQFLQAKGGELDAGDREAYRSFRDAADSGDNDGNTWSDVRADLWTVGAIVGGAALLGVAIAAGINALNNRSSSSSGRRESG